MLYLYLFVSPQSPLQLQKFIDGAGCVPGFYNLSYKAHPISLQSLG